MSDDSVRPRRYLLLGIVTFLLLGADMASVVVAKILDGRTASDPQLWSTNWYATVGGFVCSVAIWSAWVGVLVGWSRRRRVLGSLVRMQSGSKAWAVVFAGAVALGLIGWAEARASGSGFPSVLAEHEGFVRLYGDRGTAVTVFQYLYYLLESAMVLALVSLVQRAGEKQTRRALIPWGGIALSLSWGLAHLGMHPEGAAIIMLIALIYGVAFVLAEKSAPATLALVYLGFVL
ncbi:MAG: hypothetical protein RBT60_00005 [Candidatus Krumholzibacteria bacterium]|jgi:hypothetical protein|nr:hypothetical protein [Candidatus Krumholzibacteria bacterium]